jgi:DNA ligase-1
MKLRSDKSWEQATTSDQFADMYRKQIKEAPARNDPNAAPVGGAQIKRISEDRDLDEGGGEEDDAESEDAVSEGERADE